jgi:predicted metal-dependent hydrolase
VQLTLPWLSLRDPARRMLVIAGRAYEVTIVRHRRARRYLLRVGPNETLRLTVPRGAAIAEGLRFVGQQAAWIERERARQHRRGGAWRDGSTVLFRGVEEWLRVRGTDVACGTECIPIPASAGDLRPIVEAHFRLVAARELPPRCLTLAARHGLHVARVSVRNQRSRWGSCSPRRMIALNWRLIQMPPRVCEYVLLHELMHLRQANHSRKFWREVESVCPDWRDSERWLRKHGRELL